MPVAGVGTRGARDFLAVVVVALVGPLLAYTAMACAGRTFEIKVWKLTNNLIGVGHLAAEGCVLPPGLSDIWLHRSLWEDC